MRNREDRPRKTIANCDKHRYFPELKQELLMLASQHPFLKKI